MIATETAEAAARRIGLIPDCDACLRSVRSREPQVRVRFRNTGRDQDLAYHFTCWQGLIGHRIESHP